jgi:hypothetical protein
MEIGKLRRSDRRSSSFKVPIFPAGRGELCNQTCDGNIRNMKKLCNQKLPDRKGLTEEPGTPRENEKLREDLDQPYHGEWKAQKWIHQSAQSGDEEDEEEGVNEQQSPEN